MTPRSITVVASEVLGRPGTGGAGTADSLLAVGLARSGHRVNLVVASGREMGELSPDWARIYASADVEVRKLHRQPRVAPTYLAPAFEIFRALCDRPSDVVIVNDWRGLGYFAMRARQLGRALTETAFIVHCHGPARWLAESARKVPDTLGRFGEEVAERASVELADAVVSPSEWLLHWMRDRGWPVPASARVIQYVTESAVLGESPLPVPTGSAVRRVVLFGPLREGKGIRIFLQSINALEPELLDGIDLVFLGPESARWTGDTIHRSLSPWVRERVAAVCLETDLTRTAALQELRRPGTLAVMPSLLDNSPNTVLECLEYGIPFLAAWTGGIPELIAASDRQRVLFKPTVDGLATALRHALKSPAGIARAHPARELRESLEDWCELVQMVAPRRPSAARTTTRVTLVATGEASARRAERLAGRTRAAEVEVVPAESRQEGLTRATSDWIVFLDDEDTPDDEMLDVLVAAQAASAADAVTAAVRSAEDPDGLHLFLGDPGSLGLVENQYGVVGLIRRALLDAQSPPEGAVDPDWLLLARLALAGARIVSVPEALSTHTGRPGQIGDLPGEGLAVLVAFEDAPAGDLVGLPQLAATLAASFARLQNSKPGSVVSKERLVKRSLSVLRAEGIAGLSRRAKRQFVDG